jgi:aspartyl-tRNA(Asn)/glutamyl-tRNA(Gln) amidotransferase subunit A
MQQDSPRASSRCLMPDGELPVWALDVAASSRRIASGALSPCELMKSVLARIDAVDDAIGSYVHIDPEGALAEAAAATTDIARGRWRGPLHGIPFAVKDNYDAAGMPCATGSKVRAGRIARRDAELVARLRKAGAILIGKLSTWEYGTGNGAEYFDLPMPPARNPWDLARFTGGSSTGAGTAVAAGTALFALGSDTTGSVRLPAGATGTVGFIATQGVLSGDGILPNCYSLDVPGPITWTVADCALVLDALLTDQNGTAPGLARSIGRPVAGLRVAVVRDPGPGFPAPDAEMAACFEAGVDVLRGLGVAIEEVSLPISAAECLAITQMIGPAESAAIHEEELRTRSGDLGRALREKLLAGSAVRAVDYITALRRRTEVARTVGALMSRYNAIITYGALHLPPRLGVEPEMTAFTLDTMLTPFNLAALPAMVQCNGFTEAGLPTHWQIVGNRYDEAGILAVAAAYEAATGWRARRPVLPAEVPPPPPPVCATVGNPPTEQGRARALRVGLAGLSDADIARWEELTTLVESRGATLPRPREKEVQPTFGLAKPPG